MLLYARRIGTYIYPNKAKMEVSREHTLITSDAPGLRAGRASFGSKPVSTRISIKGALLAQSGEDRGLTLRQLAEEFEYAHRSLDPDWNPNDAAHHPFWLTEDLITPANSRVIDVSVKTLVMGDYEKPLTRLPFSVELETGEDAFSYSPIEQSQTLLTTGASTLVSAGGTAFTPARLSLTLTRVGAGSVTVLNDTNKQAFKLFPSAAGTYVIDTAANTVLRGTTDALGEMDEEFLFLESGDNYLRVVGSGGVACTAATCFWKARYR